MYTGMKLICPKNARKGPWGGVILLAILAMAAYFMYTRHAAMISGDTFTYVKFARLLARGQGAIEGPVRNLIREHGVSDSALATPVWNTVVLPDGRWVYTVAPGYPLLLAGLFRLGGEWAMLHANIFLQLAALAAFFSVLAQALRGRPWRHAAALAGVTLLLGLNISTQHQFVQLWREPFIYLLLLAAAAAFVELDRRPTLYWAIPPLMGLACATKESNVLYAVWMGLALLLHPAFRARPDRLRAMVLGAGLFLLGCLPLLYQNWSFTGRPWTSIYVLRETSQFSATAVGAGLSAGNFTMILGRYARMYQPYAAILVPLVLVAGWGGWRHRRSPAAILFAGWLALHLALYLQWGNADFRHMYFANYPVVFFATLGLHDAILRAARRPWLQGTVWAVLVAALGGIAVQRQPARPVYQMRDWWTLAQRIAAPIDPAGVLLVNRPSRDVLGGYTELDIIRFHELLAATGQAPAALAQALAQAEVPIYFLDAPDHDPASVQLRRDLAAMDWKYLLQGCDPDLVAEFQIDDRRIARFLGRARLRLYRLHPWGRREDRQTLPIPAGGAAFLAVDPKGLDDDLDIALNGAPLPHDFRTGAFIPVPGEPEILQVAVRRRSGGLLPRDFDWKPVTWEAPMIMPAGEDARPDDRALFDEIPPYQPIQARRRFLNTMRLQVPVREGSDLFTVVQVDMPYTVLEGRDLRVQVEGGDEFIAPIYENSLWVPVPPRAGIARRAGYRHIQVAVPGEEHLSVDRLVSRAAWRTWPVPPDRGGELGLIVAGWLVPVGGSTACRYFEGEREITAPAGLDAAPRKNPFASYLTPTRIAARPRLRWVGAGLMDLRTYPVERLFRLLPNDPLDPALTRLFHPVEMGNNGLFRWTGPDGEIRLPCADGKAAYRLRLLLAGGGPEATNRVEVVLGGRIESIQVDNEVEPYEWTIPGQAAENDWVTVSIKAAAWSPADFGSRDHRTLGVQWHGLEWERIAAEAAP